MDASGIGFWNRIEDPVRTAMSLLPERSNSVRVCSTVKLPAGPGLGPWVSVPMS